jgi:hypothetical protein
MFRVVSAEKGRDWQLGEGRLTLVTNLIKFV